MRDKIVEIILIVIIVIGLAIIFKPQLEIFITMLH